MARGQTGDHPPAGLASVPDSGSIDQRISDVLPMVPQEWVVPIIRKLSGASLDLALREKIVRVAWGPRISIHAVVSPETELLARANGLHVAGRLSLSDFHQAVFNIHGAEILDKAINQLAARAPQYSARMRLTPSQSALVAALLVASLWAVSHGSLATLIMVLAVLGSLFFLMVVILRLACLLPRDARRLVLPSTPGDRDLPVYSVLVPLFRETAILDQLIRSLCLIDYPHTKLDIKLILEENDWPMRQAVGMLDLPRHFEVIVVPEGKPQTKPRALNYALQFARGSLLTIYDSEDIPEPSQLKRAAARFAGSGGNLACLQAALTFYNPNENWLTRQFAAEYAGLFHVILPRLADYGLPLPLGGTSNHFRVSALEEVGAWDPFNVTEDADLGLRLARLGYATSTLPSTTYEEANVALGNWIKQRRRWLKGFLQTWLVHNRQPGTLFRELGFVGFCAAQSLSIGVFASALLHPFLLISGLWQFYPTQAVRLADNPVAIGFAATSLVILFLGYGTAFMVAWRGLRLARIKISRLSLLGIPLYWMLMSIAAWMALWDFIVRPFHWHKTQHGLSRLNRRAAGAPKPQAVTSNR